MRVAFGCCVLDTDTREVLRDGRPVHLTPLAFRLLTQLIEQRPRALSKGELQDLLWPGTFVTEASLSSLVADLRAAIGDDARGSSFIRTVHRHGYAFGGEARVVGSRAETAALAIYRLIWRDREFALEQGETVFGRSRQVTVFIDEVSVSRRHARIVVDGSSVVVEDLGSKNGTTVNGDPIAGATPLQDGDVLALGSVEMRFRVFVDPGVTKTTD
jgi:DNA-binding winged helix-turn-helix (wHTH) protein